MKMKKTAAVMIAGIMSLAMMAGCSGGSGGGSSAAPASSGAASSAAGSSAVSQGGRKVNVGVLSILNLSEEDYANVKESSIKLISAAAKANGLEKPENPITDTEIRYYDTLDAMLMALDAGEIESMEVPGCTANYLVANNDKVEIPKLPDGAEPKEQSRLLARATNTGFSFMMKEDKKALRDDFDKVIAAMKSDGTLDKLIKEYITDAEGKKEQKAVQFEGSGSETIKVAVTGALPPMDYVAPDGTFAGFNTAILAEIGKRLGKKIEIKQVDSVGRATALASGEVDVVFWTRVSQGRTGAQLTDEQRQEFRNDRKENTAAEGDYQPRNDPEVREALSVMRRNSKMDMPVGTVVTDPYYTDQLAIVIKKR